MQKTKVLHIITNLALGGAQKNALAIISGLDKKKYSRHFMCAEEGVLSEDLSGFFKDRHNADVSVCFLKSLKRRIAPFADFCAFFSILDYIWKNKIEIVHTHSSKAGILGRFAARAGKVKIIIHSVHGWSFNDYMPVFLKGFYVFLEKLAGLFTTAFITVSESDIRKGIRCNIGKPDRYYLIRYGIEKIFCLPGESKEIAKKQLQTVGTIACLKPQKQPLDFIKMAEILVKTNKHLQFITIGDGVLRPQIEKRIKRSGLEQKVRLCGWQKSVVLFLKEFDVFVLNSLWEGLPIALIEAMALSKPIVAYDTDGISEIVHNGINGFLVKQKDVDDLAAKVDLLLNNKEMATEMGKKSRLIFEKMDFSDSRMNKEIDVLYQSLMNR